MTAAISPIALQIEAIDLHFANGPGSRQVLHQLSCTIRQGELVCLIGPSGCGKSTLLKVLAGFLRPDRGRCLLDGQSIAGPGPDRCVVFQEDALFPWLTALENIAFGLKKGSKKERLAQAERFLELVGLAGYGNHLPRELSGGMKQRVALARVLILAPKVLLMDEPFGALDAQSREQMQELLLALWQETGHTILFITHDIQEALLLADRILLMDQGRIVDTFPLPLTRPRDPTHSVLQKAFHQIHLQLRHFI